MKISVEQWLAVDSTCLHSVLIAADWMTLSVSYRIDTENSKNHNWVGRVCTTYFESQQKPLLRPIDRLWACEHGPASNRCIKYSSSVLFSGGIFVAFFLTRQQKAQTNFLALISSRHTCHHTFRLLTDALLFAIDLSTCVIIVSDAKWTHVECRTAEVEAFWCCAFQAALRLRFSAVHKWGSVSAT